MTLSEQLAAFVVRASFDDLSVESRRQLKIRVLDALGCAIGALTGEPILRIRAHVDEFGGPGRSTLIGGGTTAPDRAAFYNSALVRYLDFNDSYLAPGETCHPSDNLGAVLAAADYATRSGRDFLTALAVAYQVQCRLSDVAPVRAKGFDHTTQGSYAVSAAVAKALGLDEQKTANAVAIAGTAFIAMRGITGPREVFEGNKGFMDAIAGHFEIDWSREDLERVRRTIVKKFNAEIHSQSALEGILELKREGEFSPAGITQITNETFDGAYHIIGGGEEGDKTIVRTKEEADNSLPYMVAVAVLDDQVMPEQYLPERVGRDDVQKLLRRITVRPSVEFSRRFPDQMPCRITVELRDGRRVLKEKTDYEGFQTRPMSWETALKKFERLAAPYSSPRLRAEIVSAVDQLDELAIADLSALLGRVRAPTT